MALITALVVLIAAGAGVGAYFYGKSTGEDLDSARAEGRAIGQKQGTAQGTKQGYAAGFREGRKKALSESYPAAYRKAYEEAFEKVGLAAPKKIKVPEP